MRRIRSGGGRLMSVSMCVFALVGCGKQPPTDKDTGRKVVTASPAPDKATDDLHKRIVDDATNNYKLGPMKAPIAVPSGTLGDQGKDQGVSMSAHDMIPNDPSKPAEHLFVGVFYASRPYKRLGVGKGNNYVVKLIQPHDTLYVIVPEDLKLSMSLLHYDPKVTFNHDEHQAPQVVDEVIDQVTVKNRLIDELVFGGCVEGSQCPSGHCAISGIDGSFTFARYKQALDTQAH